MVMLERFDAIVDRAMKRGSPITVEFLDREQLYNFIQVRAEEAERNLNGSKEKAFRAWKNFVRAHNQDIARFPVGGDDRSNFLTDTSEELSEIIHGLHDSGVSRYLVIHTTMQAIRGLVSQDRRFEVAMEATMYIRDRELK